MDRTNPCLARGCGRQADPAIAVDGLPLCRHHIGEVYHAFSTYAGGLPASTKPKADPVDVVYYLRFADHIKIGTTGALTKRLKAMHVHPDSLLAVEPGDRKIERQRHAMFAVERFRRTELFTPSPGLWDHIGHVRSLFGDPRGYLQ
jgi:hypothetical protein